MSRHGVFRTITVGATGQQILPPSTTRKAIVFPSFFSGTTGAYYTVSTDSGVIAGTGINVFPNASGPTIVDGALVGDSVQHAWYAVSGSAPIQLGILDVYED